MNLLYSTVNTLRDRYTPARHVSTFRKTGQITPEEFVAAGDYLVYKFPSWSWADAEPASRRVSFLPAGKQYLVTRNVPCRHRLSEAAYGGGAGGRGLDEEVVEGAGTGGDEDGWLRTGGDQMGAGNAAGSGAGPSAVPQAGEDSYGFADEEDDDIPDMEEEDDDEAIIPEVADVKSGPRNYSLYIMYSPFYLTPRLYLSGYRPDGRPLPPHLMMDDIVGDYQDKTVTLEDFPFFDHGTKMASVHPCKHAPVMKTLLDRADSALKRRREKLKTAAASAAADAATPSANPNPSANPATSADLGAAGDGDWEEVQADLDDGEVAIRVDQYLIVFLKFIASVTPGIEHDFTMSV